MLHVAGLHGAEAALIAYLERTGDRLLDPRAAAAMAVGAYLDAVQAWDEEMKQALETRKTPSPPERRVSPDPVRRAKAD